MLGSRKSITLEEQRWCSMPYAKLSMAREEEIITKISKEACMTENSVKVVCLVLMMLAIYWVLR